MKSQSFPIADACGRALEQYGPLYPHNAFFSLIVPDVVPIFAKPQCLTGVPWIEWFPYCLRSEKQQRRTILLYPSPPTLSVRAGKRFRHRITIEYLDHYHYRRYGSAGCDVGTGKHEIFVE